MNTPLKVAIEALISAGREGGIEQYLIGLLNGIDSLGSGHERYAVVHWQSSSSWLELIPRSDRIEAHSYPEAPVDVFERAKRLLGAFREPSGRLARWVLRKNQPIDSANPQVPTSDGFWEGLNANVLHITYPLRFFRSNVPTLFTLYDLQHRHLPEFFSNGQMRWREALYPEAFRASRAIVTISGYVKNDLIAQYGVPAAKIFVVPVAPPTAVYAQVSSTTARTIVAKLKLPPRYMVYPAVTYSHKNHIRLLEAIALLRDREGLMLNLVCTGSQQLFWPQIRKRLHELRLADQVRFLGFVPVPKLRAILACAEFLTFPSLFEGAGIPLVEAFSEGLPVACADIAAFREYGADAPFFFDPKSIESIAAALKRMSTDAEFRHELCRRGSERVRLFDWRKSAEVYRALYRQIGGGKLTHRDEALLASANAAVSVEAA